MDYITPPVVLAFAGNDPSGGAGLCADIQALASQGCHAAPVITCITIQDTNNVLETIPLSGDTVATQALAVLDDMPVAVCKIGLLGSVEIVEAVQSVLLKYPRLPVVFDPVLAAGGGKSLMQGDMCGAIINKLLPLVQIITPNSVEAGILTGVRGTLDQAGARLLEYGCQFVCITGTHEDEPLVINRLYGEKKLLQSWNWSRLPGNYHGSGCTFAASLAGLLAQGEDVPSAVYEAQRYTWESLRGGYRAGHGQILPNRLFRFPS